MAPGFLGEFVRNPVATAAVAPSSQHLARAMCDGFDPIDYGALRHVVEYGPGTGVFTRAVLERLANAGNHGCRLTAFEINPRMAENLRQAQPRADVRNADALTVVDVVDREKLPPVDLVVSGLGWPSLPAGVRDGLLDATREILSPGGEFRTFGYHVGLLFPGAWAFRARCRTLFGSFERGPVIWRNLPPAFVYRCVKPALSKRR